MSIRSRKLADGSKRYAVDEVVGTKADGTADRKRRSCRTMAEAKTVHAPRVALREATRGGSSGITLADYVERFSGTATPTRRTGATSGRPPTTFATASRAPSKDPWRRRGAEPEK